MVDGLLVGDGDVERCLACGGVFADQRVNQLAGLLWVGKGVHQVGEESGALAYKVSGICGRQLAGIIRVVGII